MTVTPPIWTGQNTVFKHGKFSPRLKVSMSITDQAEHIYQSSPNIPKNLLMCWSVGTLIDTTVSSDGRLLGGVVSGWAGDVELAAGHTVGREGWSKHTSRKSWGPESKSWEEKRVKESHKRQSLSLENQLRNMRCHSLEMYNSSGPDL